MPDRWGVGTGTSSFKGKTHGSGTTTTHGQGQEGASSDRYDEVFSGDETVAATWLEWDIPNATSERVSFSGMRDNFIRDYRGAPPSQGLLSVSRVTDDTGGETWSIGASEALTTALLALLAALGYKFRKDKKNGTK
jgi:hypothetical protein